MTKTALVTGGARGIGRACALVLADSGFDIALVDLLEKEMAARTDHLNLFDQCAVGRRDQRCQQACLCCGQGRNFGPHPLARKRARAESVGQCDLPRRCRDRPVARPARRTGGSADRRDCAGPVGTPEDVASIVRYLAVEAHMFMTGQHFVVHGFQWSC